jgi:hypothetical protein
MVGDLDFEGEAVTVAVMTPREARRESLTIFSVVSG